MEPAVAAPVPSQPPVVFRDGFGERRRVTGPSEADNVDVLYVRVEHGHGALHARRRSSHALNRNVARGARRRPPGGMIDVYGPEVSGKGAVALQMILEG